MLAILATLAVSAILAIGIGVIGFNDIGLAFAIGIGTFIAATVVIGGGGGSHQN